MDTFRWICLIGFIIVLFSLVLYIRHNMNKIKVIRNNNNCHSIVSLFKDYTMFLFFFFHLLFLLFYSTIGMLGNISAMDVYEGKTELQYTIKNGEVVDSIVVFKQKYIEKNQ